MFVGREPELAILRECLHETRGGTGRVVALIGQPGVGKTWTADAFRERARSEGFDVHFAAARESTSALPFAPWRSLMESLASARGLHSLRGALDGAATNALATWLPSLASHTRPPLSPADERAHLFDAVTRAIADLARARTLVACIDDLQWADADSIDLARHLAGSIARSSALLLFVTREPRDDRAPVAALLGDLARHDGYERVALGPLSPPEITVYLRDALGAERADRIAPRIAAWTGGHPLYLREVARALRRGTIDPDATRVPASLREHLAQQTRALSDTARACVEVTAAIGEPSSVGWVAAVLDTDPVALAEPLHEAVKAGILRVLPQGYEVVHDVVRQSIVEEIAPARRPVLHRAIANHAARAGAPPAQIAMHYVASLPLEGAEAGVPFALAAAEEAARASAHERAASLLHAAERLASRLSPVMQTSVTRALALALGRMGRAEESIAIARRALEVPDDDAPSRAQWLEQLARVLSDFGAEPSAWRDLVARALPLVARDTTWAKLTLLDERYEPVFGRSLVLARRVESDPAAVAIARASGDPDAVAAAGSPYAWRTRPETDELEARAGAWPACAAKVALLDAVVRDRIHRHPDYEAAQRAAEHLRAVSREIGHLAGEAEANYQLAKCRALLGDLDGARLHAAEVPAIIERCGPHHRLQLTARTALHMEIGYLGGADFAAIARSAREFLGSPRAARSPMGLPAVGFAALAHALAGEHADASMLVAEMSSLLAVIDPRTYQHKQALDLIAAAAWHARDASSAPALLHLEQSALDRASSAPIACTELCEARLWLLRDEPPRAVRAFDAARVVLRERRSPGLEAIAQHDQAIACRALRTPEGRARAERLFAAAYDRFVSLGMKPWAESAQQHLGRRAGPDGLTRREIELLAQLAAGHSNKEIAQRLALQPATVQRHIANIYGKIGVRNRAEATRYAVQRGLLSAG